MTVIVAATAGLAAAMFVLSIVAERRRRDEYGRLSKRQLLKYR
jgi:hypothetical protein